MINFELTKEAHINTNRYGVLKVGVNNYNNDVHLTMVKLIGMFNQEYTWDGMFKIDDVKNRIEQKDILFILFLDKSPIGYVWFKELNKDNVFLYNLYVTKSVERSKYTSTWFVNSVISEMLEYYSNVSCECEEWNISAQNIFLTNNFQKI